MKASRMAWRDMAEHDCGTRTIVFIPCTLTGLPFNVGSYYKCLGCGSMWLAPQTKTITELFNRERKASIQRRDVFKDPIGARIGPRDPFALP